MGMSLHTDIARPPAADTADTGTDAFRIPAIKPPLARRTKLAPSIGAAQEQKKTSKTLRQEHKNITT